MPVSTLQPVTTAQATKQLERPVSKPFDNGGHIFRGVRSDRGGDWRTGGTLSGGGR